MPKALDQDLYRPKVFKSWSEKKLKECLKLANDNLSEALRIHDLLHRNLSDNFLVKVDRASMAYQVEVRSPFLDYRFAEFSQRIPNEYKVNMKKGKLLLREIAKDLIPDELLKLSKRGFKPPIEKWILSDKYKKDLFKALEIVREFDEEIYLHFKDKALAQNNKFYNGDKIKLFIFGIWYKKWISQ